jgi:acyl carrier protein
MSDSNLPNTQQIEQWIVGWLAKELRAQPSAIDVHANLATLGASSRQAVALTADLGDWIGLDLLPNLFFKHQNIASLAQFLGDAVRTSKQ